MDISLMDLSLVPVVVGLVEVAKKTGLPSRYASVASLVLGVAAVWVLQQNVEWLPGALTGLAASGLWSGTKAVVGK